MSDAQYATVDPWIISADTPAEVEFLSEVFGATERGERMLNPDGSVGHAEVAIGDSVLMLFDAPTGRHLPTYLRVYVDDLADVVDRAVAMGARVVTEPSELFWGDHVARFRDPQGHLWWVFQQPAEPLDESAIGRRMARPDFAEAMDYAQKTLLDELRIDSDDT
jgi:PhnB protein